MQRDAESVNRAAGSDRATLAVVGRPDLAAGLGHAEALLDVRELAKQTRKSADRHGNALTVT